MIIQTAQLQQEKPFTRAKALRLLIFALSNDWKDFALIRQADGSFKLAFGFFGDGQK